MCRRSESKGDAAGFVRSLVRRGHYPPLEFARIKTGLQESENVRRIREQAAEGRTRGRHRADETPDRGDVRAPPAPLDERDRGPPAGEGKIAVGQGSSTPKAVKLFHEHFLCN